MIDNDSNPHDDEQLVRQLREGDNDAFQTFLNRYGDALHKLAKRRLGPDMRRRLGPEDVVQSVCRTFFRRASQGEFDLPNENSLWRLLCAITVAKVRMKRRFHTQQQRNVAQEEHLDSAVGKGAGRNMQLPASGDSPDEIAEFADEFNAIISQLDAEEQNILNLKLNGYDSREIAEQAKCSTRTVRRIQARIRGHLTAWLDRDEYHHD